MIVYGAFITSPDYNGPPPTLKGVHETPESAAESLYPGHPLSEWRHHQVTWTNGDGCFMIQELAVQNVFVAQNIVNFLGDE